MLGDYVREYADAWKKHDIKKMEKIEKELASSQGIYERRERLKKKAKVKAKYSFGNGVHYKFFQSEKKMREFFEKYTFCKYISHEVRE